MFSTPSVSHAQGESSISILLFGDSIISGYRHKKYERINHQMEKIFKESNYNIDVINAGVSGDTTAGGRNRITKTIVKHQPDIIFIALGGNDLLRGLPIRVIRSNLEAMLKVAKASNSFVILSAVEAPANYGVEYQRQFNEIYPSLSAKYQVPLYPFLIKNTYGRNHYMQSDGIHPSPEGTKFIARELTEYFINNFTKKKQLNSEPEYNEY
jgi:acyl-CoA thioesterase-1